MEELKGFDFYGEVLHFGNRTDIELEDNKYLSWQARKVISVKEGTSTSILIVTDTESKEVARFLVAWSRVA